MTTYTNWMGRDNPILINLKHIPGYFLQPVRLFQSYRRSNLRPDLIAGITIAVILLPQAIAFALIAELPPQMGLYAAIVGAIVGALWASSNHIHTGPTNAISLLVFSTLITVAAPGTPEFIIAAGMLAVMAGIFQLVMGLARLGMLVNFVSHSVIVGFSTGAAILIVVNQLRRLLGLSFSSESILETFHQLAIHLPETHWWTTALGLGTIVFIVALRKLNPKLPASLISMIVASIIVFLLDLDDKGVDIIGQLPQSLPPLADLPLFDLDFIAKLSMGALAIGTIGLVETTAISRSIASQTEQRLNSNQEFVGQGLANIAAGFFSGYPCAGSFSRSAVNFESGAKTPVSAIFSGLLVLLALFTVGPLAAYVPRTALAGVLIVTAYNMIDRAEISRILYSTRGDALIMVATFLATLLLPIEFAVLLGILLSFAYFIMKTSIPQVQEVLPDDDFKHFIPQPHKAGCPQLASFEILGDLYFGAVSHVEETLHKHLAAHPNQRYLMLRMRSVNQCDFSGIHSLESIVNSYRALNGDVYLIRVHDSVLEVMKSTGFYQRLEADHFLTEDQSVVHIFHRVLDPAVCIYECNVRAFIECQNLPKHTYSEQIPLHTDIPPDSVPSISPQELWQRIHNGQTPDIIIDVREPREFEEGHIPQAQLIPLPELLLNGIDLPTDREITLVCRSGRRGLRAAYALQNNGYNNVRFLRGGMLAWEANGLLAAIDILQRELSRNL